MSERRYTIRPIVQEDIGFLWDMLFYAARMEEDGAPSAEVAKQDAFLAQYVDAWGKPGDIGCVAVDAQTHQQIGATWARLLPHNTSSANNQDGSTLELAIAVLPGLIGKGVGGALLRRFLDTARLQHPAVMLTVRADNPAVRLYERHGFAVVNEIVNRVGTKSYVMLLTWVDTPGAK